MHWLPRMTRFFGIAGRALKKGSLKEALRCAPLKPLFKLR